MFYRTEKLKDEGSDAWVNLFSRGYANMQEDTLDKETAYKTMKITSKSHLWKGFGQLSYGAYFLQNPTASKVDKDQGLQLIKQGIDSLYQTTGNLNKLNVLGSYAYYLSMWSPQKALIAIDNALDLLEIVNGRCVWSKSDMKRIKAKCLMDIGDNKSNNEIELLLSESVNDSINNEEMYLTSLKCLATSVSFYKKVGNNQKLKSSAEQLRTLYQQRHFKYVTHVPTYIRNISILLESVSNL